MSESIKRGEIPDAIQQAIVDAALRAATNALVRGLETTEATEHARTTAEAGVRAWQATNGITS
ncbi:hypothetical protein BOTU111921_11340 [Bordetella tumbae]